jgi:hypothetical protein
MKKEIQQKLRKLLMENTKGDIVVTLPKHIKWSDYEKELDTVKDGVEVMNFKVPFLPKVSIGAKCYIAHDGFVKGWMEIVGLSDKGFDCTTTGQHWDGKFVQRSGKFNYIEPIPMKGFQGFRYIKLD